MSNKIDAIFTTNIDEIVVLPNILDIDTKSVKCFLCNEEFVTGDESFLLFNERLQSDGSSECPLAQILTAALDTEVNETTAHSSLLCSACNKIVLHYEQIVEQFFEQKLRIQKAYNETKLHLESMEQEVSKETSETLSTIEVSEELLTNNGDDNATKNKLSIKEELNNIGDVFDPLESNISVSNELPDNIQLLTVHGSIDFDNICDDGIIIYEETMPSKDTANLDNAVDIPSNENSETTTMQDILLSNDTYESFDADDIIVTDHQSEWDTDSADVNIYDIETTPAPMRILRCRFCDDGFTLRKDLNTHLTMEHNATWPDVKYECEICNRCFEDYRQFRSHKRSHSTAHKFECDQCHKKYNCKTMLDEHMNVHFGLKPFCCTQCPKKFSSRYTLHTHLKTHGIRERPHKCDECGKSFLTTQNLLHHKKIHTNERLFVCEVCTKTFATQHNLDAHSIVHSGKRPFACQTCGKMFARRAEVTDHERIHTGDRPFKCDLCEMAFAQRSNLTAHKKSTHFNEKLHKCEICGRSFKRRRLLDYHTQAVHTGERPFKCSVCSSSFVYPEHFKKHQRIHTGDKPFECEVCGKRFNSRDNRNAHRFVHSEKKPYECVECGAGFMRKPLLLSHMKQMKHTSDRIVVNRPQISGGKLETTTVLAFSDENEDTLEELILPHDVNVLEAIIPAMKSDTAKATSAAVATIVDEFNEDEDNVNVQPLKNDISVVKYLDDFNDFETSSHQTLNWDDIPVIKD